MAIGLLLGSYSIGMAQSNAIPQFNSDSEKQTWIDNNPEAYAEMNGTAKQISAEEKKALMKEHQATVVKTDVKVAAGMKVAGNVNSVDTNAALKDAAARKEIEAKKVKSTTPKK